MDHLAGLHGPLYQPHLLTGALRTERGRPLLNLPDGEVMSVGQFHDLTSRYVQAFAATGLKAGAHIGILSANRIEVLAVVAACLVGQYVLVPLHPAGSLDDQLYVVEDAGIEALVFDPANHLARARDIDERAPSLSLLSLGAAPLGRDLSAMASGLAPRPLVAPEVTEDDLYRLSYSGGTTGQPKAIMGTHRTGLATVQIQMSEWEWPSEVRQLVCGPLSHAAGSMFLPTLLRGGTLTVLPAFDPVAVMQAIERHRITCVLMVPTMIYALLDHPDFGQYDLSSLETIFYGAAAMSPPRLREAIAKLGPIFFQFYGQAEAPMSIAVMRRREHVDASLERLSCCGRPVPWITVALLDEFGREVPDGEPGEICVRGSLVMKGYHNRPELTAAAFEGDWLHTGDVAVRSEDGFLRIVDRKKDMIVTGGFNVYPREVEDVLALHPAVSASAVIGLPDEHWGEVVTAIVVLRADTEPCAKELVALVREKKGPVQTPKRVVFVADLPLTPLGKPDKKALRARFVAHPNGKLEHA